MAMQVQLLLKCGGDYLGDWKRRGRLRELKGLRSLSREAVEEELGSELDAVGWRLLGLGWLRATTERLGGTGLAATLVVEVDDRAAVELRSGEQWRGRDRLAKAADLRPEAQLSMKAAAEDRLMALDEGRELSWDAVGHWDTPVWTERQRTVVRLAKFSLADLRCLWRFWLSEAFPHGRVGKAAFAKLVAAVPGFARSNCADPSAVFRAFDAGCTGQVDFAAFATGLALLQPNLSHGRETGEARTRAIFRFFATQPSLGLSKEEKGRLAQQILADDKPADKLDKLREGLKKHLLDPPGHETEASFVKKVGMLLVRGTSSLLRLQTSTFPALHEAQASISLPPTTTEASSSQANKHNPSKHSQTSASEEPITLDQDSVERCGAMVQGYLRAAAGPSSEGRPSACADAEEMLRSLDFFARPVRVKGGAAIIQKAVFSWGDLPLRSFAAVLARLAEAVQSLVESEARCLNLPSPVHIVGPLQGSLASLRRCEAQLWPQGLRLSPAPALFLGDYVGREGAVEALAALLAHKVLQPAKVHLLRGRSEAALRPELAEDWERRYGEEEGRQLWSALDQLFQRLPLAATLEGRLLCVSGGVPESALLGQLSLRAAVDRLPVPLPLNGCQDSPLAWQLLWNGPAEEGAENGGGAASSPGGFRSEPGGSGAKAFNGAALGAFLERSGLDGVVRCEPKAGVRLRFQGRMAGLGGGDSGRGLPALLLHQRRLSLLKLDGAAQPTGPARRLAAANQVEPESKRRKLDR